MYYRGAAAAIVVYDITKKVTPLPFSHVYVVRLQTITLWLTIILSVCLCARFPFCLQETFNGAKSWVKELQRRGDPNVVIALAGNKADMENKRKVNTEEAQQYAQDNEIIFMETSAKTSLNVKNLFTEIGKATLKKYLTSSNKLT